MRKSFIHETSHPADFKRWLKSLEQGVEYMEAQRMIPRHSERAYPPPHEGRLQAQITNLEHRLYCVTQGRMLWRFIAALGWIGFIALVIHSFWK